VISLAFSSLLLTAQAPNGLPDQMASLKVHTALIFPSQAIDDSPVWSPDSHYLAANVQGTWFKVDLGKVRLKEAKWHEQPIAVVEEHQKFQQMTDVQVNGWMDKSKHEPHKMQSKSGVRVETEQHELSTAFVLTDGKRKKVLWNSDLESCGELSVSPDGRYVAFICETNGVFITDIDEAFKGK
jgi:hypothetical protein